MSYTRSSNPAVAAATADISTPFDIAAIIGFNPDVPILNLTTDAGSVTVAVAAAHVVTIYEAISATITVARHLYGNHESAVHTIGCDRSGRFVLTASSDACNIWDRQLVRNNQPQAIRQLAVPFGADGEVTHACLSADGRYVLLSGARRCATDIVEGSTDTIVERLQFWMWSAGRDVADEEYDLPTEAFGAALALAFNPFASEPGAEFAVTLPRNVLFGRWQLNADAASSRLRIVTPKIHNDGPHSKQFRFRMTAFDENNGRPFTITDSGHCTLWTCPSVCSYGGRNQDSTTAIDRTIIISRSPLIWCGSVDGVIVVLDANGRMRFFDSTMRIVYVGEQQHRLDANRISFDLVRRRYRLGKPAEFDERTQRMQTHAASDDGADEPVELLDYSRMPKCTTPEKWPFAVRRFVAVDRVNGRLLRCDLVQRRVEPLPSFGSARKRITSFDVLASRGLLVAGCADGQLFVYDYKHGVCVFERHLDDEAAAAELRHGNVQLSSSTMSVMSSSSSTLSSFQTDVVGATGTKVGVARTSVTFVMFIKGGKQLLVSTTDPAELQIVDTIVLEPISRTAHPSDGTMLRVCVSGDLIAFSDSQNTTILIQLVVTSEATEIRLIGKHRSHTMPISCLVFINEAATTTVPATPSYASANTPPPMPTGVVLRLIAYSEDRYLTEYDVLQSLAQWRLVVRRRLRCEQSARVKASIQCVGGTGIMSGVAEMPTLIVTCGSLCKVKLWHPETLTILRTVQAPLLDGNPVHVLCQIPKPQPSENNDADDADDGGGGDGEYLAFASEGRMLGLQLLPFDGNAFRHVGQLAHSKRVQQMIALPDGRTLMTLGVDDCTLFVWHIRRAAVQRNMRRGGEGLLPFCRALPGGRDGWLFREMQDLFYYMQIVARSRDCPEEQTVSDALPVAEVPDFMRALGLFLSEFEAENLMVELTSNLSMMRHHTHVTFGELLKAYVNHRPAKGYAMDELRKCLQNYGTTTSIARTKKVKTVTTAGGPRPAPAVDAAASKPRGMVLDRDRLINICCTTGERFSRLEAVRYLRTLTADQDEDWAAAGANACTPKGGHATAVREEAEIAAHLNEIPATFDFNDFLENVFGLETKKRASGAEGYSFMYENDIDPGAVNAHLNNAK